ncbi:MAG: xanthan lyase [Alistipes sp.]|nr:xanthan lyase [Alistipes sp.]
MKKLLKYYTLIIAILVVGISPVEAKSKLPKATTDSIASTLQRITLQEVAGSYVKIKNSTVRGVGKRGSVDIYASVELAYYPMRPESVENIYESVRKVLPTQNRNSKLRIYADGKLIDELIPLYHSNATSAHRFTNHANAPLITRISAISQPTKGLENRHIALWQSHGYYFKQEVDEWKWQRPRLWETVEDLFTQSYVLPYIVPMLERAGATVLLPRERSTRTEELIIDNNKGIDNTSYTEHNGSKRWQDGGIGFAHLYECYPSGHNPFTDGTTRKVATTTNNTNLTTASWGGEITQSGIYSVYVSYNTLPESVTDAHYIVHATGGNREFCVNQQMGGGMWVCLGDFYFEEGLHDTLVSISNLSEHKGVITADAVKIGGGMGNICRSVNPALRNEEEIYEERVSGYPRFTEGARYWLQWSGFSTDVYAPKEGLDDYKEDYMSRAHWVNALMGGSERLKKEEGKNIPVDLALAVHSDAGVRLNDDIIGTLGIYSTKENKGKFEDRSLSRLYSRDLTDLVMSQIVSDIRHLYEPNWTRRGMWDRAYYEARIPGCPTMLLELLSHQNFADMRYGLDPSFRFDVSRAIYKGVLRYLSSQYNTDYVVQPLPVNSFAVELLGDVAHLSWSPTTDPLEPTATPEYYILYTRVDDKGFDCGRRIDTTSTLVKQEADKVYSYRITAVNAGGESFDSETLSACATTNAKCNVMIINGFDRISAPMSAQGDSIAGFYNQYDSGAGYIQDISFIGEQIIFDRKLSRSENENNALGTSYTDYEDRVIAGNSFDYPALHGNDLRSLGYSFCSASAKTVECGNIDLTKYPVVDLILGKQRTTTVGRGAMGYRYKALNEAMQKTISNYTANGGNIFISGNYLLNDLWCGAEATDSDKVFAEQVLHVKYGGNATTRNGEIDTKPTKFASKRIRLSFNVLPSEEIYSVESPEIVTPSGKGAITALQYSTNRTSAAVAYRGEYSTFVMGFPYETIVDSKERITLLSEILNWLTK